MRDEGVASSGNRQVEAGSPPQPERGIDKPPAARHSGRRMIRFAAWFFCFGFRGYYTPEPTGG